MFLRHEINRVRPDLISLTYKKETGSYDALLKELMRKKNGLIVIIRKLQTTEMKCL